MEDRIEFIISRRSNSVVIRVPKKYWEKFRKIRVAKVIVIPIDIK